MATFIQMMAKYPEVVKRAQAEVDNITKQERLPILEDRRLLPVIDCVMKEVFRCDFIAFKARCGTNIILYAVTSINAPVPMCKAV